MNQSAYEQIMRENAKSPKRPCYACAEFASKTTEYLIPMCSPCAKTYGIVLREDAPGAVSPRKGVGLHEDGTIVGSDVGRGSDHDDALSEELNSWDVRIAAYPGPAP